MLWTSGIKNKMAPIQILFQTLDHDAYRILIGNIMNTLGPHGNITGPPGQAVPGKKNGTGIYGVPAFLTQ